jgi:hypothetical protein
VKDNMAGSTRIPKADLTGIYGWLVKRVSRRMFGDVAEPIEEAWHNRKVLNVSFAIGRRTQTWDACESTVFTPPASSRGGSRRRVTCVRSRHMRRDDRRGVR